MSLWDEVKTNLREWYGTAADRTGELAKVGIRRYDIFGLSRDIERHFSEIGGFVYHALNEGRTDFIEDPVLTGLVENVRELEAELQGKEREIEEIRETRRAAGSREDGADAGGEAPSAEAEIPPEPEPEADSEEPRRPGD